jgi:hypothetical protein
MHAVTPPPPPRPPWPGPQTGVSYGVLRDAFEAAVGALLHVLLAAAPEARDTKAYTGGVDLFRELTGYSDAPRTKVRVAGGGCPSKLCTWRWPCLCMPHRRVS